VFKVVNFSFRLSTPL
jgi:hypothetical protein